MRLHRPFLHLRGTLSTLLTAGALHACAVPADELPADELGQDEQAAAVPPCTHYVSSTAADPGNGTAAAPWRKISYAVAATSPAGPGSRICVLPGVYRENVEIKKSGSAAARITLTKSGAGEVVIDGTIPASPVFGACPAALAIYGQSHWNLSGITFTHRGNAGFTGPLAWQCQSSGVQIQPSATADATNIRISNSVFRDIATVRTDQLGLPLGFGSYVPGRMVQNIEILQNTFRNNDTIAEGRSIWVGSIAVVGDARDFLISRNLFDDADSGGVETAGNQNGHPLQPVRGVIADNQFLRSGSVAPFHGAGVYLQAAAYMTVERNFFDRTGMGVSIYTEYPPTATPLSPCPYTPVLAGHVTVRDNVFYETRFQDFRTGANNATVCSNGAATCDASLRIPKPCNYQPVDSVYFTNNTIYRPTSNLYPSLFINRNPTAGLVGDNLIMNNLIMTSGRVFEVYGATPLTTNYNYFASTSTTPLFWDTNQSWAQWQATRGDGASRLDGALLGTIFVSPTPSAPSHFALSSFTSTPPHNMGAPRHLGAPPPTTPPWLLSDVEWDFFGNSRDNGARRDLGADEY